MNKQTSELLTLLLNSPGQYFKYEELAVHLRVSTRSVRNYIQSILLFLKEQQMDSLLSFSDKGIAFTGNSTDSTHLLQGAIDSEFYLYRLSPQERVPIIVLKLLLSDDYCNLFHLSEKFNVSRATVIKDMDQVREFISHYNITFHPSMNRGYLLCLPENQRREIIVKIVFSSMDTFFRLSHQVNIYERFLLETCDLKEYLPSIQAILLAAEKDFNLNVSDACFEELLLTVAIMAYRLQKGKAIEKSPQNSHAFQDSDVYNIANNILSHLSAAHSLTFPVGEIEFLAHCLYNCHFYSQMPIEDAGDIQLQLALTNFLIKVSADLSVPLYEDKQISEQLESHLRAIAKAHFEDVKFKNEYSDQMIHSYPGYYQIVRKYVPILEQAVGYLYDDDDITFILFYIVVAIDHYCQSDRLARVIIVCHTGIGTANFLAEQLKANFNINIVSVTSNHKLHNLLENCSFDLIISTITLTESDIPWIKVSPMLEDSDIINLMKIFMDIKKEKSRHKILKDMDEFQKMSGSHPLSPSAILKEENILLDIPCDSWQSAIRESALPLLADGSIVENYIEAMLQSAEINGAYFVFCPHVALAHADPKDGVCNFGLSLLRPAHPIPFGHKHHDPVSYIICMAIHKNDIRIHDVLKLMTVFSNPLVLSALDCIKDKQELIHYLMKKEVKKGEEINDCKRK